MHAILTPSHSIKPDEIHALRLFWIIEGLVALSFTIESLIEIFLLPENASRWLLVIGVIDSTALALFFLARAGYIRQAGMLFVFAIWALTTWLAITEGGIRSPTVDISYLMIILVAGLVIDELAGIITGILCALTLLALSIAGVQGLLPPSQVHRTILTTWEADVFYLAIVIVLQYLAIHSIKEALAQAHQELLERHRVEANLRKSEEERAQSQMRVELHRLLAEQIENERLKIARDLHDGPVQDLIGASFSLQSLMDDAPNEPLKLGLREIQTLLLDQISGLRAFTGELRSPTLLKFGLAKAIREHIETFQEKNPQLDIQFQATMRDVPLSEDIRLTLFRIYQEVMNNILKHAQATQVSVNINEEDNCVHLEIQDNGKGFTLPEEWMDLARHGHLGLVGMRERAETIGGRLEILTQKNQGTKVMVTIPRHAAMDTKSPDPDPAPSPAIEPTK